MKYLIEKVNVKDPKTYQSKKTGKEEQYWPVGVKIKGVWYNANIFEKKIADRLKEVEGTEIPLSLYDEEYNGTTYKKFRIPSKLDNLVDRVDTIEKELKELKQLVDGFLHPAKVETSEAPAEPETEPEQEDNDLPF